MPLLKPKRTTRRSSTLTPPPRPSRRRMRSPRRLRRLRLPRSPRSAITVPDQTPCEKPRDEQARQVLARKHPTHATRTTLRHQPHIAPSYPSTRIPINPLANVFTRTKSLLDLRRTPAYHCGYGVVEWRLRFLNDSGYHSAGACREVKKVGFAVERKKQERTIMNTMTMFPTYSTKPSVDLF